MASITSLSNSSYNTSSIYGNRNVLSGLASGMDTEQMIENAVSGIKLKIQNLIKKRTKVEWQQEAYRSIIDKAVNFNQKYTSYSSKTNLLSQSFFNNAVNTAVKGTYKDKVTASGKTNSVIKINAVKQMATAATYTVSGQSTPFVGAGSIAGDDFDILGKTNVSTVSGSLTFQYGGTNGTTFDISFDELENLDELEGMEGKSNAEKLAKAIENKLSEVTYNYTKNGFQESTTADKAIKVNVGADGKITFSDGLGNGNTVKISSATGNIKAIADEEYISGNQALVRGIPTREYLAGKDLGITFNGSTKTINMSDVLDGLGNVTNSSFVDALNRELDKAFGAGKIEASYADGKLSLTPKGEGDTMSLGGTAAKTLGFESGDSNFVNTSKKVKDLLGDKADDVFSQDNRLRGTYKNYDGKPTAKTSPNGSIYYEDDAGNRVDEDGFRIDSNGKALYDFEVNGAHINVTEDTTLEGLVNAINANPDAGVKVSYSKLTNEFKFTTTETGANSKIEFGGMAKSIFSAPGKDSDKVSETYGLNIGEGESKEISWRGVNTRGTIRVDGNTSMKELAEKLNQEAAGEGYSVAYDELSGQIIATDENGKTVDLGLKVDGKSLEAKFNASYANGQDAIMDVEINGKRFENLTRSSNSFDLDGLSVNVKGTFNEDGSNVDKDGNAIESITFETTTDSDKIVDTIREFVNDYNAMITEIKNQYSTQPATKNDKSRYEPLTAEEEEQYSESELAAYNEKAKQGILFGDSILSSMYGKLLNAIQPGGTDGQTLREIGIGTSYESGLTTISLDEDKLRAALESDPDKVKTAFTKTREGGASSDGLMQTMQNTLNSYVKTTGEPKGVLITRAGSVKAPVSLNSNSLKSQIDSYDNQIERWQNKMSDQIDRYTTQFSRLEQLIAEMNSQASAFAGLMGGGSGY